MRVPTDAMERLSSIASDISATKVDINTDEGAYLSSLESWIDGVFDSHGFVTNGSIDDLLELTENEGGSTDWESLLEYIYQSLKSVQKLGGG